MSALQITTAQWCNRWLVKQEKWTKVIAWTGGYPTMRYGEFNPAPGWWATGVEKPSRLGPCIDGPLQPAIVCAPVSGLVAPDIDHMDQWPSSPLAAFLNPDRDAISVWDSGKGARCHMLVDMRAVLHDEWPKQRGFPAGDMKSNGFIPLPGSQHYSQCIYQPAIEDWWMRLRFGTPDLAAAMVETVAGSKGVSNAHRERGEPVPVIQAIYDDPRPVCQEMYDAWQRHAETMHELAAGVSNDRHSAAGRAIGAVLGLAMKGHPGAGPALDDFAAILGEKKEGSEGEFDDVVNYVAAKEAGGPYPMPGNVDPCSVYVSLPPGPQQQAPQQELPAENPGRPPRPRFEVTNRAVAAENLRENLGYGKLAGLYMRGGVLVHTPRVGEDGYVKPTPEEIEQGIDHGPAQVRPVTPGHVKALCDVVFEVGAMVMPKGVKKDEKPEPVWVRMLMPPEVADTAVKAAELGIGCPNLHQLRAVTHTPVMRRDGSVLAVPGYDRHTGLLYLPTDGALIPVVPDNPGQQDLYRAVGLILEPLREFPFVKAEHLMNYLGAMFTPILRLLLKPPYPMIVITATNPGSGKTLLLKMLGAIHGVTTRGEFPRDRDEMRKMIISTLLTTTAPVIGLDNVRGTIYSSELEALLTSRTLNDRILGATQNVEVTNDRLWTITGNNARIGGDLARRCLPVALDPRCEDPYRRTGFKLDPVPWMTASRGAYLAALLTVARGWIQAGAPKDIKRSDDYADWEGSIRGMLAWMQRAVGWTPVDFGLQDEAFAVTEDDEAWGAFVWELHKVFASEKFTSKQVVKKINGPYAQLSYHDHQSDLADALPGDLPEKRNKTGFTRSIGRWFLNHEGRITPDKLTVRKVSQPGDREPTYQIQSVEARKTG